MITECVFLLPNNTTAPFNCSLGEEEQISYYNELLWKLNLTNGNHSTHTSISTTPNNIFIYGAPIIVLLGTVGNLLSILTFFHFMLENTIFMYFFALSIVDLFGLYIDLFYRWIGVVMPYGLTKSGIGCKSWAFFVQSAYFTSVWLIVAIAFERYLPIYRGSKTGRQKSFYRKRSLFFIFLIFFFATAYSFHNFWTVDVDRTSFTQCLISENHSQFMTKLLPWINQAIIFFVPGILILTLNGFGRCRKLKFEETVEIGLQELNIENDAGENESSQFINSLPRTNSPGKTKAKFLQMTKSTKMLTSMLTAITLSFLLTHLPGICLDIVHEISTEFVNDSNLHTVNVMIYITNLLGYLYYSTPFYLYCICNRDFRDNLGLISRSLISKFTSFLRQRRMNATVTNTNLAE